MENTSEYIKDAREKLGLTQQQFAEKIGSKRNNIAKYETDRAVPPGDIILKVKALIDNK